MPHAFARKSPLILWGIVSLLLLTSCASAPKAPSPPPLVQEEAASETGSDQHHFNSLPLILMPGLEAVVRSDEHRHIFTKHLEVSSNPEITEAQRALVAAKISAFTTSVDTEARTVVSPRAELNIRSHLVAISENVMGIRIESFESTDTASGTNYQTQWFDLKHHAEGTTRDLFDTDASWVTFKKLVTRELNNDPQRHTRSPLLLEKAWLDSVTFDLRGNALVQLDDDAPSTEARGPLMVSVKAEEVTDLLSDFGASVRSTLTSPRTLSRLHSRLSTTAKVPQLNPAAPQAPEGTVAPKRRSINCSTQKCVALTFDDGPGPKTAKLLDHLKAGNAPSTFFVTGPNAKLRPQILQRIVSEGHQIGNHTWNHRSLPSLSLAQIRREIDRTDTVITEAVGSSAALLRPPYGARNSAVDRAAKAPVILWDVDTLDWKHRNTAKVVKAAVQQSTPGSIVLMHDIHSSTVDAIPAVISGLKAKGYTLVTVGELMGQTGLLPGETYSSGPHPVTKTAHKAGKDRR